MLIVFSEQFQCHPAKVSQPCLIAPMLEERQLTVLKRLWRLKMTQKRPNHWSHPQMEGMNQ